MMNFLAVLVVTQIVAIFFKRTLVGKLVVMIFKTIYKLARTILIMDLRLVCKVYRIVADQGKKYQSKSKKQKQPIKKAVGGEEINYDNVIDIKQYKKKGCKGQ